jgi:lipid II:glycine glycyltransferase (peptidoglycan interpeptide bridge formation enzyme)
MTTRHRGIAPTAWLELDLSAPPDTLRKQLSSGTRGSIKRASSCGVRVRTAAEHDLPVVAELLAETAPHHRFPPLSLAYQCTLYRQLDHGNHIKIFIAEHDGVPVAAQVLTNCGGVTKLRLTGMRRADAAPTGAAALLQWETILGARANGCGTFDFGGISPSAVDAIRAGRTNLASRVNGHDYFKASFGGQPLSYPPPVERFSSTIVRIGYDLARRSALGRHGIERARRLLRRGRAAR